MITVRAVDGVGRGARVMRQTAWMAAVGDLLLALVLLCCGVWLLLWWHRDHTRGMSSGDLDGGE